MAPLPRAEFLARLRRIDRHRFVAFVAAVWRARGADVSREGRTLRVRTGAGTRLVHVHRRTRLLGRAAGSVPDAADAVVTNAPGAPAGVPEGVRVVDADELYELVLYGIDREDADGLCREYLDRPATVHRGSDAGDDDVPFFGGRDPIPVAVGTLAAVLIAASFIGAVGGGVVGPTEGPGGPSGLSADEPPRTGEPPTPIVTDGGVAADPRENIHPPGVATDAGGGRSAGAAGNGTFPPGVGPGGVTDYERLASAHAEALAGRSYRLVITYREFAGGRPVGFAREEVRVTGPTTHAAAVERFGQIRYDRSYVGEDAYANGSARVLRTADGRWVVPVRQGTYAERVEQYLGWFLSVERSSVIDRVERDGRTEWFVRLGDDPWWGAVNASGTAVIDDRGVVRSVRRSYEVPDSNVTVVVSIRHPRIGGVTVEEPAWYRHGEDGTVGDPGSTPRSVFVGRVPRAPDRDGPVPAIPSRIRAS